MHTCILRGFIFLMCLPVLSFGQHTEKQIPFTYKVFRNLAYFFDSREDVAAFFELRPGDVIADIGAGSGKHEAALSLLADSLQFYAEDIDATVLTRKAAETSMRSYARLRGKPQTCTVKVCIGTEKETNLPDAIFDKIIIISAFHEFTYVDAMIDDLIRKLKAGGKIYIVDAVCYKKGHTNRSAEETVGIMKAHGFALQQIDTTNRNDSEGLYRAVFTR